MVAAGTPVIFVHGLWLHASAWGPWMELFRDAGYEPVAPGWPGEPDTIEEARRRPESVAGRGVGDVVDHYARIIGGLGAKPIVIGHSFGGIVAQRLLGQDLAAAAVAIDAAPIKGVLALTPAMVRFASYTLRNPANRNGAVMLTAEQFRYGFGNAVSAAESSELYERWAIPSPGRPIFEASVASLSPRSPTKADTGNATRGPLLLTGGGKDHAVPAAVSRSTYKLYRDSPAVTEYREFPDRGHALVVDSGWREVCQAALDWLKSRSL
jgi:non-heme chloroperoxidase